MNSVNSLPPPGIDSMLERIKDEMCGFLPLMLSPQEIRQQLVMYRSAYAKALHEQDLATTVRMEKRIEQYAIHLPSVHDAESDKHTDAGRREYMIRNIAHETLTHTWNECPRIYSKAELIQRAIYELRTPEFFQGIVASFSTMSPNGSMQEPNSGHVHAFIQDTIAYLQAEMHRE